MSSSNNIQKVYSIYDSASEVFRWPYPAFANGAAIHTLIEMIGSDPRMYKYPECYTLFEIGSYSLSTGVFEFLPAKVPLGNALEFMSKVDVKQSVEEEVKSDV